MRFYVLFFAIANFTFMSIQQTYAINPMQICQHTFRLTHTNTSRHVNVTIDIKPYQEIYDH